MTIELASIILLSILFWTVVTKFQHRLTAVQFTASLAGYAIVVCGISGATMFHYFGFGQHGSPLIGVQKQRSLQHLGYYAGINRPAFRFVRIPKESGEFYHNALGDNEWIDLAAREELSGDSIGSWTIQSSYLDKPLRVNDRCVNIDDPFWLKSGDALSILRSSGADRGDLLTIRLAIDSSIRGWENTWLLEHGSVRRGTVTKRARTDTIAGRVIDNALSMQTLLKNSGEAAHSGWINLLQEITIVREQRDDRGSRIGILIGKRLCTDPSLSFTKNSVKLPSVYGGIRYTVASGAVVTYGQRDKERLSVELGSVTATDAALGKIVEVRFTRPEEWPLPPNPDSMFIITSSNEFIALDGYSINIGNPVQDFYAKARVNGAMDSIYLNDGITATAYPVGTPFRLGDIRQGTVLMLSQAHLSMGYIGWYSSGVLIGWTFLFCLVVYWSNRSFMLQHVDRGSEVAWSLVWGAVVTLLTVKLIISYRVSLLPPVDASEKELANVFRKSFDNSYTAYIVVPGLMLIARVGLGIWPRIRTWVSKRGRAAVAGAAGHIGGDAGIVRSSRFKYYMIALAGIGLLLAAGAMLGRHESFFMRINSLTHLLLIASLVMTARWTFQSPATGWIMTLLILAAGLAGMIFIVGDVGFIIYGLSLAVPMVVIGFWSRRHQKRAVLHGLTLAGALGLFTAVLIVPPLLPTNIGLINLTEQWGTTVPYRFSTLLKSEESLLLAPEEEGREVDVATVLRNKYQDWQMLLYATEGCIAPKGYGNAILSKTGMTYPTQLADCMFSVFILSEHGPWMGIFLLALFLWICFVCFIAGNSLPSGLQYRYLPLAAIGGYFACNAMYMAGANIGQALFAGQNIPFLSLYSRSDTLQNTGLIILIVMLLFHRSGVYQQSRRNDATVVRTDVRAIGRLAMPVLAFWFVLLSVKMFSLSESNRLSLDFSDRLYHQIRSDLPASADDTTRPWRMQGTALIQNRPAVNSLEKELVREFNRKSNKTDPEGSIVYLAPEGEGGALIPKINRYYFAVRSPFTVDSIWKGSIFAQSDTPEPAVGILGASAMLSLRPDGHPTSINIFQDSIPPRMAQSIRVTRNGRAFFELEKRGNRLFLQPKASEAQIYVEGTRLLPQDRQGERALRKYDLIVVQDGEERRRVIFLGFTRPVLAFTQWRNGSYKRVFPLGEQFSYPFALGLAADEAKGNSVDVPDSVVLTVDICLQKQVQEIVATAAKAIYPEQSILAPIHSDIGNRVGVTIMDAFSGNILSLASWPQINPNDPAFMRQFRKANSRDQSQLLRNNTLANHVIGSTAKPLFFASVTAQLWSEGIDLAKLVVEDHQPEMGQEGHEHGQLGNICLEEAWRDDLPMQSITPGAYLTQSEDYYEGIVGMIGTLIDPSDWHRVLQPCNDRPDLYYDHSPYKLDLRRASISPFTLGDPGVPHHIVGRVEKSLLLQGTRELFDVDKSSPEGSAGASDGYFLPSFAHIDPIANPFMSYALPSPVVFNAARDFQLIRKDFIPFLLGAGSNRWNNVKLAEAAARLATGRKVHATIEYRTPPGGAGAAMPVSNSQVDELPLPISDDGWRNANLISPLHESIIRGSGQNLNPINVRPPYYLICKTGTVNRANNGRECETLLFILGKRDDQNKFIPGKTIAGYIYLEDSKPANGKFQKFDFARPLINELYRYLGGETGVWVVPVGNIAMR